MRYSLGAALHLLSLILVLATEALITNAWSPPLLKPRPNPITIQLYADADSRHPNLINRSPADNTTFGAAVTGVNLSNDQQYVSPSLFSETYYNTHYHRSYYTVIKTGNISLRVVLDTASSDLWVVSSSCQNDTCTKVPRYPLTYDSPTFAAVNDNTTTFIAQYADTTCMYSLLVVFCTNSHNVIVASGFVARETIEVSNLTVANQVFALITNSNVTLTDRASGIMGLGFPRLSSIPGSVFNCL